MDALPPVWTCAPNAVPASSSVPWADALSTPLIPPCCTRTSVHVANRNVSSDKMSDQPHENRLSASLFGRGDKKRRHFKPTFLHSATMGEVFAYKKTPSLHHHAACPACKRHPSAFSRDKKHEDLAHGNPSDKSKKALLTSLLHRLPPPFSSCRRPFPADKRTTPFFSAPKLFPLSAQRNSNLRRLKPRIQKKCVINT